MQDISKLDFTKIEFFSDSSENAMRSHSLEENSEITYLTKDCEWTIEKL